MGTATMNGMRAGATAPTEVRTHLVGLARFIQGHGFRTEVREDCVWLWIPWTKADGEEGEDRFEVRTLGGARAVLGY